MNNRKVYVNEDGSSAGYGRHVVSGMIGGQNEWVTVTDDSKSSYAHGKGATSAVLSFSSKQEDSDTDDHDVSRESDSEPGLLANMFSMFSSVFMPADDSHEERKDSSLRQGK